MTENLNTKKKYSFLEAKSKIESYCAYQERCHKEVVDKLYEWGQLQNDIDILIADLISNRFLDEERFAEAYVSGKYRIKKWGRNKIKIHLKQKHISDYSINKALKLIDNEEYQSNIKNLANKKLSTLSGNKWEKMKKLQNYLLSKGYESEHISELLKELLK